MFSVGQLLALFPLAVVGAWRWGNWLGKVLLAWRYDPADAVVVDYVPRSHVAAHGIDDHSDRSVMVHCLSPTPFKGKTNGELRHTTVEEPMMSVDETLPLRRRVVRRLYARAAQLGIVPPPEEDSPAVTPVEERQRPLSVSVVTPVYDADPDAFMSTVRTWAANEPDEIIAVIDEGDTECIRAFRAFADRTDGVSCVVTPKPGKRPALRDGASIASGDLIALVDDDVRWREETLEEFVKPFADPDVGAVSCKQIVRNQRTLPQRLYEIKLRLDYGIDSKVLSLYDSQAVVSGRTAVYRRESLLPVIDGLPEETFLNKQVVSGDDKYLTRAVQADGWKAVYQSTSPIDVGATPSLGVFIKQTIRWTRNAIRSDIMAYYEGWVLNRRTLAYYYIDRFLGQFAILFAPLYFIVTMLKGSYLASAVVLVWWLLSRSFKIIPYVRLYTDWMSVLPFYIVASFLQSPVYIYALYSANTQGWLTRGDDSRFGFGSKQTFVSAGSVVMTALTLGVFLYVVYQLKY